MLRETRRRRPDWVQKVERLGLFFHTVDERPYWNEGASYRFQADEISILEAATKELHEMCLAAVERVIANEELSRLGIPAAAHSLIAESWETDPPAIYGRFDLSYDGYHPPQLLEYNADTPTSLLEAAVVQWHWLQEVEPGADQFNSLWEGLIEKWSSLQAEGYFPTGHVHFGCMEAEEDLMTTAVLMDTAREAGLGVSLMHMREVGWDHDDRRFVDPDHRPIQTLFKLYPWEWMLRDKFGQYVREASGSIQWIEPIWKMVLSNKAILAILWEMFPGHPNLLPAYLDGPRELAEYVRKPFLGREGANISIRSPAGHIEMPGPYNEGGYVYQGYSPLPVFDGNHAVIGSWVVDGEARGIGVRESDGPVTEDLARFVPHYFST